MAIAALSRAPRPDADGFREDAVRLRRRIGRLSAVLRIACLIGALAFALGGLALLVLPGAFDWAVAQSGLPGADEGIGFEERLVLVPLTTLNIGLYVAALLLSARLFSVWREGEVFTEAAASAVAGIGLCLILTAVLSILTEPITSFVLTWDGAEGERAISLSLDGEMALSALTGSLLTVIGLVMRAGLMIAEENAEFV
ncbi:MAG: DUF2975 domain-containing protein [Pseudomonadota bacterium]